MEDKQGYDFSEYVIEPLMTALGEDIDEILAYLNGMAPEDLQIISGSFEDIYRKFTTDEVYKALEELESKIA